MWHDDDRTWEAMGRLMWTPDRVERAVGEVDALLRLVDLPVGARVLDLPCGVGRHAIELARRGYSVTGVDRTASYLATARARQGEVPVTFLEGDMRSWRGDAPFDAAVNLYTAFGYFEDQAEDVATLRNFRALLLPGAPLVMEMNSKEILARNFRAREWAEVGALLFLEQREVAPGWEFVDTRWTLIEGTERHEVSFRVRIYSAVELTAALRTAGFSDIHIYGGLDGTPYDVEARRLVVVAR